MNQLYIVARFAIQAERGAEFRAVAADCLATCTNHDPGTTAYEWFLGEDPSRCIVLEEYADSTAMLAHMNNARPFVERIRQAAGAEALALGTPSAMLREAVSGRLVFVPRFQGLDTPTVAGDPRKVRAVAHFRIQAGRTAEFRRIAAESLGLARANDPGTSAYEWFMHEQGSDCTVIEVYDDVDMLLAHTRNVGRLVGGLLEISECSVDLLADPAVASLKALQRLPMRKYTRFQGLGN
jgi:quinol monooxygenase YgiN